MTRTSRTRRGAFAITVVWAAVVTMASTALANAPEGGVDRGTSITVVPSDNLPSEAVVVVTGAGFPANAFILMGQCRGSDLNCDVNTIVEAQADASGRFPPTTLRVSDFLGGDLCHVRNDCFVIAVGTAGAFPSYVSRTAHHHLSFMPPPLSLLDQILRLLGLAL